MISTANTIARPELRANGDLVFFDLRTSAGRRECREFIAYARPRVDQEFAAARRDGRNLAPDSEAKILAVLDLWAVQVDQVEQLYG